MTEHGMFHEPSSPESGVGGYGYDYLKESHMYESVDDAERLGIRAETNPHVRELLKRLAERRSSIGSDVFMPRDAASREIVLNGLRKIAGSDVRFTEGE